MTFPTKMSALKKPADFILTLGEICGFFVFSEIVKYARLGRLVYVLATKMKGIQRGVSPWLWVIQ